MKTITFYVVALLCLAATKLCAQETFAKRAQVIGNNIELITKQQKDSLKAEVDVVNQQLEKNEITQAQAEAKKQEYAQQRAGKIETLVGIEEQKLAELVKDKVDGKIEDEKKHRLQISYDKDADEKDSTATKPYEYKRTTSQFVYALGINRLVVDGKTDNDNYKWKSDFYEVGLTLNTRIFKNNNLLHAKYGVSVQYNNLRPNDNKVFATDGNKTVLVDYGRDIDVARLRYVNLVLPVHLEFDFTKRKTTDGVVTYPSHKSFRLGVGGYVGANIKEKQIVKYQDDNGNDVKEKTKGDFNVNDFVYGVSAYVGYDEFSIYAKYDLQPVFANNDVDQNNLSLGIRFDFN